MTLYYCTDCDHAAPAVNAEGDCVYCGGPVREIPEADKEENREAGPDDDRPAD